MRLPDEPEYVTVEALEEGSVIDAGDPTEEPVFLTVDSVVPLNYAGTVLIWTRELSFPLHAHAGEQITLGCAV